MGEGRGGRGTGGSYHRSTFLGLSNTLQQCERCSRCSTESYTSDSLSSDDNEINVSGIQRYSQCTETDRMPVSQARSNGVGCISVLVHISLFFRLTTLWMKQWYFPFLHWSPGVELSRQFISSCSTCLDSCLANCPTTARKLDSPLYTNTMLSVSKIITPSKTVFGVICNYSAMTVVSQTTLQVH